MRDLPLGKVYRLIEPGPVVLLTTARNGRANIMTMSGLTPVPAEQVAPPLVAECFANLECRVADTQLMSKYDLFLLEVVKGWIDPRQKAAKTIHHHGFGTFVVDGKTIKLKSNMR